MGRKKIKIEKITNPRQKMVSSTKSFFAATSLEPEEILVFQCPWQGYNSISAKNNYF